jgi:hypothetical protein
MFLPQKCSIRRMGVYACLLCAFLLAPVAAVAAPTEQSELESYTLTMDKVHDLARALTDLSTYIHAHPEVRAKLETAGDEGESLDAAARRMAAVPEIVELLGRNGFQPREFLLAQVALAQSAFAVAHKPLGQGDRECAAQMHLNPANLSFIRLHHAELRAMEATLGAMS